ncbi:MAG: glycosyltransferase family 4 protein [Microthrixaceae bacterium]|nr:glycosyltransferase family 4 protein [Microthrixaceae bacterium]
MSTVASPEHAVADGDPDGAPPIRVLWVAKGLGPGGMERLLVHQAAAGDRERFDYHAAYVVDRPNSVVPELEGLGVPVHRLDGRLGPLGWGRALRRLVLEHRIDVVHLHSPAVAAVARPALRSLHHRPAVMTTEHNSWDCYSWPTRLINVTTYPLDDARLAVSQDAIDSVPRPLRGRSEVLVHGIDLTGAAELLPRASAIRAEVRRELGITPDAPVVIVVANHRREKGWDVLIEAAQHVRRNVPGAVILGVGHGGLENVHRTRIAQLDLGATVRLLGFRSDVDRLMVASDVFALGSRQEGLPVAVMEAMALGLPVVAPRVGGLPLAVEHGASGLLVAPEDPVELGDALGSVLADQVLRAQLADGALGASSAFDVRRAVQTIESHYSRLATGADRARGGESRDRH